jgi:hypothetical protein
MPVFGADPDSPSSVWEDAPPVPRPRGNRIINELLNYFGYHKNMQMSQRFNDQDRAVLANHLSRRLKQGFTVPTLKSMIDRFYQTPAGQSDFPAMLFCKGEVQKSLMVDHDVDKDDPIIQWLLDGMPNDCEALTDPRECRKAVLLNSDESLFRYPDVVASIIALDDPEPYLSERLSALEHLIFWNLGNNDDDVGHLRDSLANIALPKELASSVRSPKSIRDKHGTVKQAVLAVPTNKKESW